jgi:hypothetical protein
MESLRLLCDDASSARDRCQRVTPTVVGDRPPHLLLALFIYLKPEIFFHNVCLCEEEGMLVRKRRH